MIDIWYNGRREGERMARERFSFDDTIEFDKDELKPCLLYTSRCV